MFVCKTLETAPKRLIYYETSEGDKGKPTIAFFHGGFTNLTEHNRSRIHLQGEGYPTLAMDMAGHGNSSALRNSSDYTLPKMTSDLKKVVDAEGLEKMVLVCHSMGTMVGQAFAAENPEQVQALILISGTHDFKEAFSDYQPNPALNLWARWAYGSFPSFFSGIQARAVTMTAWAEPREYRPDFGSEQFRNISPYKFYSDLARHTPERLAAMDAARRMAIEEWNTQSIAPKILSPTTIVHGQYDWNVPVQAAFQLHKRIPGTSSPIIIPNAGHLLPLHYPEAIIEIIMSKVLSVGANLPERKQYAVATP